MSNQPSSLSTALLGLVARVARAREQDEARVEEARALARDLAAAGAAERLIVGPRFGPPRGHGVYPVLLVPGGFGAAWPEGPVLQDPGVPVRFVPFAECTPEVRAAVLPHVGPMLRELADQLG